MWRRGAGSQIAVDNGERHPDGKADGVSERAEQACLPRVDDAGREVPAVRLSLGSAKSVGPGEGEEERKAGPRTGGKAKKRVERPR